MIRHCNYIRLSATAYQRLHSSRIRYVPQGYLQRTDSQRQLSIFSKIRKQFEEELDKNEELKQSIEEIKSKRKQVENVEEAARATFDRMNVKTDEASKVMHQHATDVSKRVKEKLDSQFSSSNRIRDAFEEAKAESEKFSNNLHKDNEFLNEAKKHVNSFQTIFGNAKKRIVGDDFFAKIKDNIKEASDELFNSKPRRHINDSSVVVKQSPSTNTTSTSEENNSEDKEEGSSHSTAVMIVKGQQSAWEKIGERLKETPIIQGIMDAAKNAASSSAGQTIGKGAKKAKDKLGDATEDAREFWETSQNPWVYRISSIYDGLFGETETAIAIREIRRTDPSFILEEWKEDVEATAIPEVLDAFLRGDGIRLKQWLGEAAYNTVNHAIRERKTAGLVVDPNVLAIRNVEIIAAKAEDKQAPIVVIQFMAQQINCIRNREGVIVEGEEDEVRAVYYALAFQRDFDDEQNRFRWKIIELAMLGAVPYV